jgi:hypothetical protein
MDTTFQDENLFPSGGLTALSLLANTASTSPGASPLVLPPPMNANLPSTIPSTSSSLADDREAEEILHDLKIFASLKENERISTEGPSLAVHKPWDKLTWVKRTFVTGDDRFANLKYITKRFQQAFSKIDTYLNHREMMLNVKPDELTRAQILFRLKNDQMVHRFCDSIKLAKTQIARVMRVTYQDDPTAISYIDRICEQVDDKLEQVRVSVHYLDSREKLNNHTTRSSDT